MYIHADRPMTLTTPLGADSLVLAALRGREAISELFHFELDTWWQSRSAPLPFDRLLGQEVSIQIAHPSGKRHIGGIVVKISQEEKNLKFTRYRLEVVPKLWLLTRRRQSRTFQHMSIPDILRSVLQGLDVSFDIQGAFDAREYCIQYRETDFNFVSRLMEEEGIFYYFKHTASGHKLVLANSPQAHPAIPYQPSVAYEEVSGHTLEADRIYAWSKAQELRSGKYVTWDDCFEMPGKHLEAEKKIVEVVSLGNNKSPTTHKLKVGGNDSLEIYDFPGGYAERYDGVDKGGGSQPDKLQGIFTDNKRTAAIRMEQEAVLSLLVRAQGGHAGFTAGHTFDLKEHFSDDGKFVIASVDHEASQPITDDTNAKPYEYRNHFTCIPVALPFRPQMVTEIPSVRGVQTAVVVGPAGEEIFTDKYGRVKVQFPWDREGAHDINSSCWLRVATFWAGKQWGAIHIPRIGQEVIVDFIEGDVNHPIIVGSVYNAENMPPYNLPENKTQSGIKSRSSKKGGPDNFNEIRFEDKKDHEQLFVHAEKNQDIEVEKDETHWVGHDRKKTVDHDETVLVKNDRTETVNNNETITVHGKQANTIDGDQSTVVTQGNQSIKVQIGNQTTKIDLGQIETEAMQSIELKVGPSSIKLDPSGITIKGLTITVDATIQGVFKSVITQVTGSAMTQVKGGIVMIN